MFKSFTFGMTSNSFGKEKIAIGNNFARGNTLKTKELYKSLQTMSQYYIQNNYGHWNRIKKHISKCGLQV